MKKNLTSQSEEITSLHEKIHELERRLAEAQAAINALNSSKEEALQSGREAAWLARLPGENPNPVVRVSRDGIVLYCNHPAATLSGWRCSVNEPVPYSLIPLIQQALVQGQTIKQEVLLGDRFYLIVITPFPEEGYANIYGSDITRRLQVEDALIENERKQREMAMLLELDRARLAAVLEQLPVGVWIADQQGKLISKNEEADRIWAGESPLSESIAEYDQYESWYPESGTLLQPEEYPVAQSLQTGQPISPVEINIRRFDGSIGTVLVSAAPIRDSQGLVMGVVGVNMDITGSKQAERELAESRNRINDVLKSLGDGLFALDRNWSIIYINEHAAKIAGVPEQELIGRNLWELWPGLIGTEVEKAYRRAMEAGTREQFRTQGKQSRRWYDVSVSPSSEGITIFYVDKTEQILAEERFNKAFHASPDALVISRQEDGRIETVNDTFIKFFGYSEEEVIGRTSLELHMFVDPAKRQEAIQKLKADGSVRDFELDVRLRSGEIRKVGLSVEMMTIDGQPMMLTLIHDVTERKRTEDALRENEQRYRSLFETMQEGLISAEIITDDNGKPIDYRYLDVNPATERQFGIPREKFIGHTYTEILQEKDLEWIETLGRVALTGKPVSIERFSEASGKWFEAHVYSQYPGQFINIYTDISERKKAVEALQTNEAKLRAVFRSLVEGIVFLNPKGEVEEINAAVQHTFGHTVEELTNPKLDPRFSIIRPDGSLIPVEEQPAIVALRTGEAVRNIEMGVTTSDGKHSWRIVNAHPVYNDNHTLLGAVASFFDITERREAEQALRESEERFRSLADSMPQLVWTALPDGSVDYYNKRHQEYRDIKQTEGQAWEWAPVLHPDDVQATVNTWSHAVKTGQPYQIEHRVKMSDGSYRWHLSRGVPMLDDKGQVIRWFGTATDIHNLKLAEEKLMNYAERLERSNRELEQFAFMASHDLQEPLRKIQVFGNMLIERAASLDDREREYVERMRNAAERMRDMVNGLLQLSRINTQSKPFTEVRLSEVTKEALSDLADQVHRTKGRVNVTELPTVAGDTLQLQQLMQNLIGNALKYHQPGVSPNIKIYSKQFSKHVEILVEDNGIGFDPENADRIFQPFQRLVGRSEYEGSGMGLAICRRIVERHGGGISAQSSPGNGTIFTVTLPINPPGNQGKDEHDKATDLDR